MNGRITTYSFIVFVNIFAMFKYGDLTMLQSDGGLEKAGGTNIYQLVKVVVQGFTLLIVSYLFIKSNRKIASFFTIHSYFFCYFLVAVFSAIFMAEYIFQSFYYSITIIISLGIGYYYHILLSKNFEKYKYTIFNVYLFIYFLIFVSTLFSILLDYNAAFRTAFDYRLQSTLIFVGSNGLSWFALVFILFFYNLYFQRFSSKFLGAILIAFACFLILSTQTRTTVIVVFSLFLVRYMYGTSSIIKKAISILSICLVIIFSPLIIDILSRGETQFTSFSGRSIMWLIIYESFWDSPLIGKGLWSGVITALEGTEFELIRQVHGSLPELLISVGIIGTFFWLAALMRLIFAVNKLFKRRFIMESDDRKIITVIFYVSIAYLIKLTTSSEFIYHDQSLILFISLSTLVYHFNLKYKYR